MKTHTLARTLALFGLLSLACGLLTPATQVATSSPTQLAVPTLAAGPALPVFAAYDEPVVNVAPAVAHEPIAADLG
jgi:hypothetical protein